MTPRFKEKERHPVIRERCDRSFNQKNTGKGREDGLKMAVIVKLKKK